VIKGYLSKWFIMTAISFIESTANVTAFSPLLLILPTPKAILIASNKGRSFKCKVIEKQV